MIDSFFVFFQVAKVAQAWASKLIGSIARGGHLQHRPNNKFGENIWMGSGYKFTDEEAVKHAVKSWYDEISLYRPYFGREPNMANFKEWGKFDRTEFFFQVQLQVFFLLF